jgi:hypothetical protein
MKEKIVNFVVSNKSLLVKMGLIAGVAAGVAVTAAIVVNRMSDPDLLMDAIVDEVSSEEASE